MERDSGGMLYWSGDGPQASAEKRLERIGAGLRVEREILATREAHLDNKAETLTRREKSRKGSSTKGLKKTTKELADENRDRVQALKEICLDCDGRFPHYVLQFDHCSGEKVANISTMLGTRVHWDLISVEIDKCEIVCANCHAIRTHERREVGVV